MGIPNPHVTDFSQPIEAATRTSRFLARIVDALVWFAPLPLLFFPCLGALAALLLWAAILIGQIWMLVTRGQTIGKKALKIYIMKSDGDIPNVGWLLIREFAIPVAVGILRYVGHNDPSVVGQALQGVFSLMWIIDSLFIFGPTRRCLHDYLAGTHVVQV